MSWVFIFRWIPKHNYYWGWKVLQYTCGEDFEEVGSNFAFCVANIQHGNSVLHRRWVENELLLIICFLCCPACLSIVTQVPRRKKALLPFRLLPFAFTGRLAQLANRQQIFSKFGIEDWGHLGWPLSPHKFCWSSPAACRLATTCASLFTGDPVATSRSRQSQAECWRREARRRDNPQRHT